MTIAHEDMRAYVLRARALARAGPRGLYLSSATVWCDLCGLAAAASVRLAFAAWLYDTGRLHDGR